MVTQLIQHERLETTLPRAKALSALADKCVTMAKEVGSRSTIANPEHLAHTHPFFHRDCHITACTFPVFYA